MSLRHKAGFLAATTLLSGSAFAFAPEFIQDLPTVIITDKLPEAEQSGSGIYDVNGLPALATEYVVRGSAMVNTRDYFSDGSDVNAGLNGNAFEDIKFRFTESLYDDTDGVGALSTDTTLKINDELNNGAVPDLAAFTGASALNGRYTAADGILDFRNVDLSGTSESVNSGFDAIGDITGQDFAASPVQKRWVDIYLNAANGKISNSGFLVISSVEGAAQDGTTEAVASESNPYSPVVTFGTFDGWASAGVSFTSVPNFISFTNPATTGYTFTPASSPATASASSLGVTTTSGTVIGLANWSLSSAFSATKNTLYRMRASVTSNAASNGIIRFSIGANTSDNYIGLGTVAFNDTLNKTSPASLGAGGEMVGYLLARDNGSANLTLEIVPLGTSGGQDFSVDSVSIDSADPTVLGTANTVLNIGGTVTAASDAYGAAPSGQSGFATGAGSTTNVRFEDDGTFAVTKNVTANAITGSFSDNDDGFAAINFEDTNVVDATVAGTFQGSVGKFYIMDVWVSTTTPAAGRFPEFQPSIIGGANNTAWTTFQLGASPTAGGTNGNPIETNSSPYSVGWTPQDFGGSSTTLEAVPSIRFLSYGRTYSGAANVTVNRIVVNEYEAFLD